MGTIIDQILGLDGSVAYAVIALLAFGEAAAFVGLLLPGEIAVVLGGVLASRGQVSLRILIVVVGIAAIAGDSAGYEIGRRWGPLLVDSRFAGRRRRDIDRVARYLRERGSMIVFLGRWTSVLRAVVPAVAGMTAMPYRRFFMFNVIGGVAWSIVFASAGYVAGESYGRLESAMGWGSWIITSAAFGVLATVWPIQRRRQLRQAALDRQEAVRPPAMANPTNGRGDVARYVRDQQR